MTPSAEAIPAPAAIEPLPPALRSMWRLCRLGYRHEPGLMAASFALALVAALPDAMLAWLMQLLGQGILERRPVLVPAAALGIGAAAVATWLLDIVSTRVQRRFRDKVTVALESHVARLQATVVSIAHHERPDYLDRLSVLRNQVFVLDHMYMSLFTTSGWILRLVVTIGLLVSVHPALALLVLFGMPTVFTASWRPAVERAAQEQGAPDGRLARHLFTTATTASPGKDVRITGISSRLERLRRDAWRRSYAPLARARTVSALWHAAAWALFGSAYVGAVAFVAYRLQAPAASVLLVLAAGSRLSYYVSHTVGEIGFLRGFWMDGARRLAWLEDYATAVTANGRRPAPDAIHRGIRFERVSFAYPGTSRLVLDNVSIELPADSVVAIVGENGAGKTTLIKLLTRMYEPNTGTILVDDMPLAEIAAEDWRARLAGAFQDFFRFELRARHTVGVGDLSRIDDEPAIQTAVGRAGAHDVVGKLSAGLETQLGPAWPEGVDVSFGQWQKLALSRGFMRDQPLLLILDEPTAALDAETEHALFERYAAAARQRSTERGSSERQGHGNGRIVVLVSHRFSTVRMADVIVVLDGAKVVEYGSHDALLARNGQYAQLYRLQAAAYQ